jgi:hypothetical protein
MGPRVAFLLGIPANRAGVFAIRAISLAIGKRKPGPAEWDRVSLERGFADRDLVFEPNQTGSRFRCSVATAIA